MMCAWEGACLHGAGCFLPTIQQQVAGEHTEQGMLAHCSPCIAELASIF